MPATSVLSSRWRALKSLKLNGKYDRTRRPAIVH
jgi:hypothetical protein